MPDKPQKNESASEYMARCVEGLKSEGVNHPSLTEGACPVRGKGNWLTRGHVVQKLRERNTYTPTNVPQVCSNCDLLLNRDQSLSVISLKTSLNNPDAVLTPKGGILIC